MIIKRKLNLEQRTSQHSEWESTSIREKDIRFRSGGIGRSAINYIFKYPNGRAWVNPFSGLRQQL